MKLIKLTNKNDQTFNNTQWGNNVTHSVKWSGKFCSSGCIHVYKDLLVALMLNPIHANFNPVHAWQANGVILKNDNGLKFGVKKLTTIKRLDLLKISTSQRIAFGIFCASEIVGDTEWRYWANNWIKGVDRSAAAAYAANAAANAAAAAAANAAANAAYAANAAAAAAANAAAYAAAYRTKSLDFAKLARTAMTIK